MKGEDSLRPVDSVDEAYYDCDLRNQTVWWSEGHRLLFGPDEEGGDNFEWWTSRIHPDDLDRTIEVLRKVMDARQPFWRGRYRFRRRNGSYAFVSDRVFIVYDDSGAPVRLLGAKSDETSEKRARDELRASENARKALLAAVPDLVFLLDSNNVYIEAHSADEASLLIPDRGHIGKSLRAVLPEDVAELVESRADEARRSGSIIQFDYSVDLGGAIRHREARVAPAENGSVVIAVRDISARKRTEDALRESEKFLQQSQDAAECGSWKSDLHTDEVYWSESLCRLHGIAPEEFGGTMDEVLDFIHPDERGRLETARQELAESDLPADIEYRIVRKDGEIRTLWGRGQAIRGADGEPTHVIGTVIDVTEQRQAEDEKRRLEAQLLHVQKLESLGVLAGGLAHDFNNLLTSILGYTSQAAINVPPGSPIQSMLGEIEKAAVRASDLTNQMLAYSGRGQFVFESLALDRLVQEMSALLGSSISKKATLETGLEPATIEGDPTQIRQIVMNLLTNASDALDNGEGRISIRTGVREFSPAELSSTFQQKPLPQGVYAFVEVEDSGSGMAAGDLDKIFDPFFTTKFTGRGLGLSAVLGIVSGHGGNIQVQSTPGQGTLFRIVLPRATASEKHERDRPRGKHSVGHGTILLADDEDMVRDFIAQSLKSSGFDVLEARNGAEALELFELHRHIIDAAVLDVTMPRIDGWELATRFHETDPGFPILLVSGYNEPEQLADGRRNPNVAFLHKPFRHPDLTERLVGLIESRTDNPSPSRRPDMR